MQMAEGMILKCVAGVYDVYVDGTVLSAYAAGKFRNENLSPVAGDRVALKLSDRENEKNLITDVFERRNVLVRPPLANIDTLIITLAVKKPNPDLLLCDQLICACRQMGIEPVICINKCDYGQSAELREQFEKSGITVFVTSFNEPETVEKLKSTLKKGITCFSGQSAVGKSTLTNMLLGRDMFETGGLSKKTERGRHTTRHTELVMIDEGKWLADTPGFSFMETPFLSPEDFKELYFEFAPYSEKCRFIGCNHISEPDCAVKEAVENNELSPLRYERYVELYNEVKEKWRRRYD